MAGRKEGVGDENLSVEDTIGGASAGSIGASVGVGGGVDGGDRASLDNRGAAGADAGPGGGESPRAKDAQGRDPAEHKKRGWPKGKPRTAAKPGGAAGPGSDDPSPAAQRVPLTGKQAADLADKLVSVHALAAAFTRQPLLQIAPEEAALLANSVREVSAHYDLGWLFGLAGPYAAIGGLVIAAGRVYGPRVLMVRQARKAAKAASEQPAQPSHPFEAGGAPSSGMYDFSAVPN
jgi:hypothetical protein